MFVDTVAITKTPRRLSSNDIERLIPHRPPMLLLDEVAWVEPGRRGLGFPVDLSRGDTGVPVTHVGVAPWPLVLEALAQLAAVVEILGNLEKSGAETLDTPQQGFLASIPSFRLLAPFAPNRPVTLEAHVRRSRPRVTSFQCQAFSGPDLALTTKLLLGSGPALPGLL